VSVSSWEPFADAWKWYSANRADLTPIGAFLGGVVIAWAALRQASAPTGGAVRLELGRVD
jgi:hypothetical protein